MITFATIMINIGIGVRAVFNQCKRGSYYGYSLAIFLSILFISAGTLKVVNLLKPTSNLIKQSKQLAIESLNLQSVLGTPIKPEYWISQSNFNNSDEWAYSFKVTGPNGEAIINVIAYRENDDIWQIDSESTKDAYTTNGKRYYILIKDSGKQVFVNIPKDKVMNIPYKPVSFLSNIYYFFSAFSQEDRNKVKWLKKAVRAGNIEAANNLAAFYDDGRGVLQSQAKAVALWKESAEGGDYYAMYNLGLHYRTHSSPNYIEALKWYKLSIKTSPNACSFNDLALLYAKGLGVKQDKHKATSLFIDAANALLTDDFYDEISERLGGARVEVNKEQAIQAFVDYQYALYIYNTPIKLEETVPLEAAEIAKSMSETITSRCWN